MTNSYEGSFLEQEPQTLDEIDAEINRLEEEADILQTTINGLFFDSEPVKEGGLFKKKTVGHNLNGEFLSIENQIAISDALDEKRDRIERLKEKREELLG